MSAQIVWRHRVAVLEAWDGSLLLYLYIDVHRQQVLYPLYSSFEKGVKKIFLTFPLCCFDQMFPINKSFSVIWKQRLDAVSHAPAGTFPIMGFQALAPEKVRLAYNDGLTPRDESEGVFPEKVPFREIFL
jgi:hypothetical protein